VRKILVLAMSLTLAVTSMSAFGETPAQKNSAATKPLTGPLLSKGKRLSDAQLDQVVAGGAEVLNVPGSITVITNPGNASRVNDNSHHGHLTIIN